jgi:hypothetical protein
MGERWAVAVLVVLVVVWVLVVMVLAGEQRAERKV